jgi:hypothetical protein
VKQFDHELPEDWRTILPAEALFSKFQDTLQPENWRTFDNAAGEPSTKLVYSLHICSQRNIRYPTKKITKEKPNNW